MTDKERWETLVNRLTAAFIIEGNFSSKERPESHAIKRACALADEIMAESDRRWPKQQH